MLHTESAQALRLRQAGSDLHVLKQLNNLRLGLDYAHCSCQLLSHIASVAGSGGLSEENIPKQALANVRAGIFFIKCNKVAGT